MPEQIAGFDPARLKRIDALLQRFVDKGEQAGVAAEVIRHGEVAYRNWAGYQSVEDKTPITGDTIYRIYSMSKTFTSVALMTLYERGLIRLHEPVYAFIPEFKNMKVVETDAQGNEKLVDAKRPITIAHLCSMTSGIPYPGGGSPSGRAMIEAQKKVEESGKLNESATVAIVRAVADIPLAFHPGDHWMYGFSHDILGAIVEIVSGKRYGQYLKDEIFDPLGLKDTAFYVPPEKRSRLASAYSCNDGKFILAAPPVLDAAPDSPPPFESGGGGLHSTLDDVSRFAQMLVRGGKLDGTRILSRKTVELIASNQLGDVQQADFNWESIWGYGYGLCVRTMLEPAKAGLNGSVGEFAWDGMLGTWYCVDPKEDMTVVFMIQRFGPENNNHPKRLMQVVYGALDD